MDAGRAPSHFRYALRSVLWAASSFACLSAASAGLQQYLGVPRPAVGWFTAALLIPMAHASWTDRRPASDASWAGIGKSCAMGVGVCWILDIGIVILGPGSLSATLGTFASAVATAAAILLPRFALRPLALGIFCEEASIGGFRGHRGRQFMAHIGVVALVAGALAVTAIPNFMRFGLLAKASETRVGINAIRAAQERWYSEHGHYLAATAFPAGPPDAYRAEFDARAHVDSGFDRLGWPEPADTKLYCRYAVAVADPDSGADAYTIEAVCDIDGDGELMAFGWVKPAAGERAGVPGPFGFCSVRGVLSHRGVTDGARVLDQFGPCDPMSGISIF